MEDGDLEMVGYVLGEWSHIYFTLDEKPNANSFHFAANAVAGFTGNSIITGDEVGKLQNVYVHFSTVGFT